MECFCDFKGSYELKIEGDVGADPIWCNQCGCNFDIEDIPISYELSRELNAWASGYGEWIDWEKDRLLPNGIELEDKHNKQGLMLSEKLKQELDGKFRVKFSPSSMASIYGNKDD